MNEEGSLSSALLDAAWAAGVALCEQLVLLPLVGGLVGLLALRTRRRIPGSRALVDLYHYQ